MDNARYGSWGYLWLAVAVQINGCKSTQATSNQACTPGETRTCVGAAACEGAQTCGNDGNTWSSCDCGTGGADAGTGGATGTQSSSGGNAATGGTTQTLDTSSYVLIDDMEGTEYPNGPIALDFGKDLAKPGYWGAWYSTGSPLNSMAPNPFSYSALPSPHSTAGNVPSARAGHLVCNLADLYGYCEMGLWFAERDTGTSSVPDAGQGAGDVGQRVTVDISKYRGIVFWGKSSLANRVKVMFNDIYTDSFGGHCAQTDASADQCWDSFSKYISFTDQWQRYEVKFSDLTQEGWGYAAPTDKLDATQVYLLAFQVNGPGSSTAPAVAADFWIDDIYFE